MKLFILVDSNPIFHPRVVHTIAQNSKHKICGVAIVSSKKSGLQGYRQLKKRIGIYGFIGSLVLGWRVLVKFLTSIVPVEQIRKCSTVKVVCRAHSIPVEPLNNVNDPSFVSKLAAMKPDIVISIQHQILCCGLLNVPNVCCLNFHPAMLPRYRGVMPIFWAMFYGEREIGLTVHTMTERIDEGHIIVQDAFEVQRRGSMLDHYRFAYDRCGDLILESLDKLEYSRFSDYPTVPSGSPYYRAPKSDQVRQFRSRGLRLV